MNKKQIEISFLIPCYNCSKTIDRCINSIITQKYDQNKIFYICCNDGSNDDTLIKLKKWQKKVGKNFVIIDQKNQGLAGVRTVLIENVKTDYFIFIDSDDYFFKNAVTHIVEASKWGKYDITVSKNIRMHDKKKYYMYSYIMFPWTNACDFIKNNYVFFIWNNLFKTSFIKKYPFKWHTGTNTYEDYAFMLYYLSKIEKIGKCSNHTYAYVKTENSYSIITNKKWSEKKIEDIVNQYKYFLPQILKKNKYEALTKISKIAILNYFAFSCLTIKALCVIYPILYKFNGPSKEFYKRLIKNMLEANEKYSIKLQYPKGLVRKTLHFIFRINRINKTN